MNEYYFHFYGSINSRSTESLINQILIALQQKNCKKISILLSSEGGETDSSFTLYNFLRSLPVPLKMINMGSVDSMAIPVFLAADERYSLKNSKFLIHSFRWHFQSGSVDYQRVLEYTNSLKSDVNRYIKIFTERTSSAKSPIVIEQHLIGDSIIIDSDSWTDSGIITGDLPSNWVIPKGASQILIQMVN